MNDDVSKTKLKVQDIINEIANLKKYNSDLNNSCTGDKLENYLNKLNSNIIEAQNKTDELYTKISK